MESIITLFRWNLWANSRYRKVLRTMDIERLKFETPYGIMLDRIIHIFGSFEMWHKRMNGESPRTMISSKDFASWDELEKKWIEFDELLLSYVSSLSSDQLGKEVAYISFDGKEYQRKIKHILLHLTAHPNYHRGQISSLFKLLNLPQLPPTDMVVYFLENP